MASKVRNEFKKFFHKESSGRQGKDFAIEVDNPSFELENVGENRQELKEKTIDFSENLSNLNGEFLKIENCPSMASAFETFIALIPSFFMRVSSALGVIMNINGFTEYFSDQQFHQVHNALKNFNRSFLLANQTTDGSGCIYWRLEGVEQIFYCIIGNNKANCVEFVAKYLMRQLKNGRTGLLPNYQPSEYLLNIRIDLCNLIDIRGYDLLLLAAECGNIEVVKVFLSQSSFDVNFTGLNGKNAADLAYEGRHFDLLLELLKNNSKFPQNFVETEFPDELNNFIETTKNFHLAIRENEEEKIEKILNENLSLKHYYSTQNVSAVATSILSQSFEIYKFLISEQIYLGPHENFNDIRSQLSEEDCRLLRECHNEKSQNFMEDHIMTLMGNSSVGLDEPDNQSKLSYALDAFKVVDKIPIISLILQIVAALKNFKITFDFQRNDVGFLDPSSEQDTNGLFYTTGRIYIAAANLLNAEKFNEVCGTIAHELCHFVMFKVFNNLAKPYAENETEKIEDYEDVWRHCERLQSQEKIIEKVFTGYDFDVQHAELIVRVPHILAHYHNDPQKLEELQNVFRPLFDFFNIRCMPEMEAALPRFIEEGKKTKTELKQKKQIKILLWSLLALFMIGSVAVFTTIILNQPDTVYDGKNLPQHLLEKVMERNVNFQDEQIRFKDFLEPNSDAIRSLNDEQVKDLINQKAFNISSSINPNVDFFIERNFQDETGVVVNKIQFYDLLKVKRALLLSDFPGAGKTTTFRNLGKDLKKKNPHKWVSYFNLQKHTDAFKNFNQELSTDTIVNLISKILKLSPLEHEIFKNSYEKNNAIFLWDGVDEVSPTHEYFIINLITFIRNDTKNYQLLSSRTYLQSKIKTALEVDVLKLQPFQPNDRLEFIQKFMEHRKLNSSSIEKEMSVILPFFQKFLNSTCDEDNPLLLSIICTIHFSKKNELSLLRDDAFSVYEHYINYKIENIKLKGPIVEEDTGNVFKNDIPIWKAHVYYAIKDIFGHRMVQTGVKNKFNSLDVMKKPPNITPLTINRFGILEIDSDGNTNFIHRTFAEYFVSKYVIENIYETNFDDLNESEFNVKNYLLDIIMDDTRRRYNVIKNFVEDYMRMDEKLVKDQASLTKRKIDELFEDIPDNLKALAFHRYNKNTLFGYFEFLAKFWHKNYKIFRRTWHVDEDENVFLFLVKELRLWRVDNRKWHKKFLTLIGKYFEAEDVEKMLLSNLGIFLYYIWRERNGPHDLRDNSRPGYKEKNFVPNPKPKITLQDIEVWASVENIEELLDIENVVDFLNVIRRILPEDDFKKIFLCEFTEISITLDHDNLQNFWQMSREILTKDEMSRALVKKDFIAGTILHNIGDFTIEELRRIFSMLEEFLNKDKIKKLLFKFNSAGGTPLTPLMFAEDAHVELFWSFATQFLNERRDVQKFLLRRTYYGNRLPLAYIFTYKHVYEKFTKIYEQNFDRDELDNLLLTNKEKDGENILHYYIKKSENYLDVFEFLEKNLLKPTEGIRKLLTERNQEAQTPFSLATKLNRFFLIKEFGTFARKAFNADEFQELYKASNQIITQGREEEGVANTCKFTNEIFDSIEKHETFLRATGIDKIIGDWLKSSHSKLSQFKKNLNLDEVDFLAAKVKPENYQKINNLIEAIGIENFIALDHKSALKIIESMQKLNIEEFLSDESSIRKLVERIKADGGLEKFINLI